MTSEGLLELLKREEENSIIDPGLVLRRAQIGPFHVIERTWFKEGVKVLINVTIDLEWPTLGPGLGFSWELARWSSETLSKTVNEGWVLDRALETMREYNLKPFTDFLMSLQEAQEELREVIGAPALKRVAAGEDVV